MTISFLSGHIKKVLYINLRKELMNIMKKKYLIYVCVIILIPVFLLLYEKNQGTPPVLTVDGMELTLGISSPDDLYSQDFEFSLPNQFTLYNMMPAYSWGYEYIPAVKDEELYAQFYVYNPNKDEVYCTGAAIYQIDFEMYSGEDSYWTQNNILVNGINFYGMNIDEVKTAMQAYKKPKESSSGDLRYKDGKYSYYIYFDSNGLVEEVSVEMDIPKDYTEVS